MNDKSFAARTEEKETEKTGLGERGWIALFCLVCLVVIFNDLGGAALFEPDEGRNAEKAREILLLGDWVTPYENFLTTLDKPMFFYWLIAVSFKIFGVSEWSARLPSVLATLGTLFLVYRFARLHLGLWEALWSCLILVTSFEFFLFSRIVIFDMTLTFFITLALFEFYAATLASHRKRPRLHYVLMYIAMGAGTLVKGPIALILPAMVIFCYLLLTRQWMLVKKINPLFGAVIYFFIVAPWYLWVDLRNPGYLKYFFWEEHFFRFVTPDFGRNKSWYYFFVVIGAGFAPWSPLLLLTVKDHWKHGFHDASLLLALWATLPFVFFSLSNAKLPQYILPIFPALALLTGQTVALRFNDPAQKEKWIIFIPWSVILGLVLYFLAGSLWPGILPREIRLGVGERAAAVTIYGALIGGIYGAYVISTKSLWRHAGGAAYLCTCIGIALFLILSTQIVTAASFHRVAKPLAAQTAPLIAPKDQIVFYGTYLEGIAFYLRIYQPIWLVETRRRSEPAVNSYLAMRRTVPAPGYGQVVFAHDEFAERWKKNEKAFRVFLKEKSLARFSDEVGGSPRVLAKLDEYLFVTNR